MEEAPNCRYHTGGGDGDDTCTARQQKNDEEFRKTWIYEAFEDTSVVWCRLKCRWIWYPNHTAAQTVPMLTSSLICNPPNLMKPMSSAVLRMTKVMMRAVASVRGKENKEETRGVKSARKIRCVFTRSHISALTVHCFSAWTCKQEAQATSRLANGFDGYVEHVKKQDMLEFKCSLAWELLESDDPADKQKGRELRLQLAHMMSI